MPLAMKRTLLFLLYDTESPYKRELISASLISDHLARRGYVIRWGKIEDHFLIDLIRPHALLLPDTYNPENMNAARYAHSRHVPVVTYESEVTYYPGPLAECVVWGWNTAHEPLEDLCLVAGRHSYELAIAQGKDPARVRIGGFHRLDAMRPSRGMTKKTLLEKYQKTSFTNCVGYASWGFDNIVNRVHPLFQYYLDPQGSVLRVLRDQKVKIAAWLRGVIEAMPETLFVLKAHPAGGIEDTEIANLDHFRNVLVIHREETAIDLIAACDTWIAWNSTTLLEAFVMKKPVIYPRFDADADFIALPTHAGADIVDSVPTAVATLNRYCLGNPLPPDSRRRQEELIEYMAVSADGRNSERAATHIHHFLTTMTYFSNAALDWLCVKSLIRAARRGLSIFLTDRLGIRLKVLKRWAGPNRFRRATIRLFGRDLLAGMNEPAAPQSASEPLA